MCLPPNFTSGIQLINLPPEVRDGFLTLIVPMLQQRSDLDVVVHSRESPSEAGAFDLRIKILNLKRLASNVNPNPLTSATSPSTSTPQPHKRLISSASTSTIFESIGLGLGLALSSPSRTTALTPTPTASPVSSQPPSQLPGVGVDTATTTSSPTPTAGRFSSETSSRQSPLTSGSERRLRKGVLASRIEERLAMLQLQQEQRPPSS